MTTLQTAGASPSTHGKVVMVIGVGLDYRPDEHERGEWREGSGICLEYEDGYRDCFYISDLYTAGTSPQPSQADAQDAARYRWLREYLPSDDLQYDDDLVLAKTGEEVDAAVDAAINAKAVQPSQPVDGCGWCRKGVCYKHGVGQEPSQAGELSDESEAAIKDALEALEDLIGEHYGERQSVVSNKGRRAITRLRAIDAAINAKGAK